VAVELAFRRTARAVDSERAAICKQLQVASGRSLGALISGPLAAATWRSIKPSGHAMGSHVARDQQTTTNQPQTVCAASAASPLDQQHKALFWASVCSPLFPTVSSRRGNTIMIIIPSIASKTSY